MYIEKELFDVLSQSVPHAFKNPGVWGETPKRKQKVLLFIIMREKKAIINRASAQHHGYPYDFV